MRDARGAFQPAGWNRPAGRYRYEKLSCGAFDGIFRRLRSVLPFARLLHFDFVARQSAAISRHPGLTVELRLNSERNIRAVDFTVRNLARLRGAATSPSTSPENRAGQFTSIGLQIEGHVLGAVSALHLT